MSDLGEPMPMPMPVILEPAAARALLECADVTEDTSDEEEAAREQLRQAVALHLAVQIGVDTVTIPAGSVLVLRGDMPAELVPALVSRLHALAGHDQFVFVVLRPGESLDVLDEDTMREQGWYRSPGYPLGRVEGGTPIVLGEDGDHA